MNQQFTINGICDPAFREVREALEQNLAEGDEIGECVSVVVNGKTVVDLWGGYKNKARTQPWERDTLVCMFSVGKPIAILAILMLADRGRIDLEKPVSHYWPEFGQAGKNKITVQQLVSHLAAIPGAFQAKKGDAYDWSKMVRAIEAQEPLWEPGTQGCYHTFTMGYLCGELVRESLNQPLILIFEDLHWIDGETQGLLDVLSESMASARILLLTNYRPEYRSEWGQKTYYTQLRLAPLGKDEAEELLNVLLGISVGAIHESPLHALKQLILEKTEGTPFFMEEIVQELFEQGVLVRDGGETRRSASPPPDLRIPPTVQGVLASRIDRLAAAEKELLQQLAVIGREFPLSLMHHVVPQSEDELYRLLASLQHKEFLYEQPAFPEVEYLFKHALTQEVAYGTVLQERRKMLHERTAQALEALYSASLDEHYGDLAHHYTRSGNTQKAVEYYTLAGQQAVQRSANAEAITHLTTALELLKTLPDTLKRARQELTLQVTLGPALMATKGYAAPEVGRAYARARELCQELGETQLFPIIWGLFVFYLVRADHKTAYELAEQLFSLAQSLQDSVLLLWAHHAVGASSLWLGELPLAQTHQEQGIAFYDPQQHSSLAFLYGHDPGMACLSYSGVALWLLGYPEQALRRGREALTLVQKLAHTNSLVFALDFVILLYQFRREGKAV